MRTTQWKKRFVHLRMGSPTTRTRTNQKHVEAKQFGALNGVLVIRRAGEASSIESTINAWIPRQTKLTLLTNPAKTYRHHLLSENVMAMAAPASGRAFSAPMFAAGVRPLVRTRQIQGAWLVQLYAKSME
jgi:hypothetical protein